jgi:hypothetical protein
LEKIFINAKSPSFEGLMLCNQKQTLSEISLVVCYGANILQFYRIDSIISCPSASTLKKSINRTAVAVLVAVVPPPPPTGLVPPTPVGVAVVPPDDVPVEVPVEVCPVSPLIAPVPVELST